MCPPRLAPSAHRNQPLQMAFSPEFQRVTQKSQFLFSLQIRQDLPRIFAYSCPDSRTGGRNLAFLETPSSSLGPKYGMVPGSGIQAKVDSTASWHQVRTSSVSASGSNSS